MNMAFKRLNNTIGIGLNNIMNTILEFYDDAVNVSVTNTELIVSIPSILGDKRLKLVRLSGSSAYQLTAYIGYEDNNSDWVYENILGTSLSYGITFANCLLDLYCTKNGLVVSMYGLNSSNFYSYTVVVSKASDGCKYASGIVNGNSTHKSGTKTVCLNGETLTTYYLAPNGTTNVNGLWNTSNGKITLSTVQLLDSNGEPVVDHDDSEVKLKSLFATSDSRLKDGIYVGNTGYVIPYSIGQEVSSWNARNFMLTESELI